MKRYRLARRLPVLAEFLGILVACYLGKAKNLNATFIGMLEPFTHKFCGRANKIRGGKPQHAQRARETRYL